MNMRTTVLKTWFLWIIGLLCVAPFQPLRAKDFVVVIDAGHGGHDAGAIGSFSKEKNINLSVALAVGKQLERDYSGIKVIFTRKTDVFVTLQGRAQIANKNKADLFVSIHTNAAAKGNTAQGTETYTLGLHRTQENLEVAKKENSVILIEDDYKTRYAGFILIAESCSQQDAVAHIYRDNVFFSFFAEMAPLRSTGKSGEFF